MASLLPSQFKISKTSKNATSLVPLSANQTKKQSVFRNPGSHKKEDSGVFTSRNESQVVKSPKEGKNSGENPIDADMPVKTSG